MSTTTLPRIELAVPVVAWTTGMNTPSTSAVMSTVITAAALGAALRVSERKASLMKNAARTFPFLVGMTLDADPQLAAQTHCELAGGLVMRVHAGELVAHEAPLVQLDDAPAHLVDHLAVVRGD